MHIVVAKTGNIGCSTVLELLLDERADRKDIKVTVVSSGAKMGVSEAEFVASTAVSLDPDIILYSTPNASAPGPKKVIEALSGRRAVVISDAPAAKIKNVLEEKRLGYILVTADAMIGARREFLDPTEMAVFNADILKVLAGTGALRLIQLELGRSIDAVKKGDEYLPRIIVTAEKAVEHAHFADKKAKEKALKAYRMAEDVGGLNVKGCFVEQEPEKYIKTVSKAHSHLKEAASLIDEARLIELKNDTLYRTPHASDGRILNKTRLMEKP